MAYLLMNWTIYVVKNNIPFQAILTDSNGQLIATLEYYNFADLMRFIGTYSRCNLKIKNWNYIKELCKEYKSPFEFNKKGQLAKRKTIYNIEGSVKEIEIITGFPRQYIHEALSKRRS